jgi:SAM-dependent methyltransferase
MTQMTSPVRMWEINQGAFAWFAMMAAMELDVFTPLDDGPRPASELAAILGVNAEKLSQLLYALVIAELLTIEDGRFANTDEAARFLVRGKPTYVGGVRSLWTQFVDAGVKTAESVRTGVAQLKHDYAAMNEEELLATLAALHPGGLAAGKALADRYDFDLCHAVLDAGGGTGGASIALAQACPGLRATIAELPGVVPITERFVREAGLSDRIAAVPVDLLREPVPGQFDAAIVRNVIQVLSANESRAILSNVWASLRPGGTVYVTGIVLDDSRLTPTVHALTNVIAISFYDHGQAYTDAEHRAWLAEAGFVDIRREEPIGVPDLFVARKADG